MLVPFLLTIERFKNILQSFDIVIYMIKKGGTVMNTAVNMRNVSLIKRDQIVALRKAHIL